MPQRREPGDALLASIEFGLLVLAVGHDDEEARGAGAGQAERADGCAEFLALTATVIYGEAVHPLACPGHALPS